MMGGQPLEIEQRIFADNPQITDTLQKQDSRLQMRPLRVAADSLGYDYDAGKALLNIELELPAGSYMTTVLEHFLVLKEAN